MTTVDFRRLRNVSDNEFNLLKCQTEAKRHSFALLDYSIKKNKGPFLTKY